MLQSMVEKTKVSRAHSKYPGFKSTVPWSLAKDWKLEAGDYLVWERRAVNNEIVVTVSIEKGAPKEKKEKKVK